MPGAGKALSTGATVPIAHPNDCQASLFQSVSYAPEIQFWKCVMSVKAEDMLPLRIRHVIYKVPDITRFYTAHVDWATQTDQVIFTQTLSIYRLKRGNITFLQQLLHTSVNRISNFLGISRLGEIDYYTFHDGYSLSSKYSWQYPYFA
jgi:hypothetical protein